MRRPFVVLFIFLFIGIMCGYYTKFEVGVPFVVAMMLFCAIVLLVTEKGQLLLICFLGTLLGLYLYSFNANASAKLTGVNHPIILQVELQSSPQQKKYYQEAEIKIVSLEDEKGIRIIKERALLQLRGEGDYKQPRLSPGVLIRLKKAQLNKNLTLSDVESYDRYLRGKGYRYIIRADYGDITHLNNAEGPVSKFASSSYRAKAYIEGFFDKVLSVKQSSLIKSILFGNQGYMSEDDLNYFSKSGTSHIIAVSGLHIGILVLLIEKLFNFIGLGKNKSLLITLVVIYLYAYLVGFPVSIIRAGFMYFLYVLAYFTNRRYDAINSLMFIATVVIALNPFLIFSISFQMSFMATLSILTLYPKISKLLKRLPNFLSSLVGVTLAAQIGTLPIIAYYFKQISIIAPLTNLLIVPTLGMVLSLGLLSSVISLISIKVGVMIAYILRLVLNYMFYIVEKTGDAAYSSIEIAEITTVHIGVYYFILWVLYILFLHRKNLIFNIRKLGKHEPSTNKRGY